MHMNVPTEKPSKDTKENRFCAPRSKWRGLIIWSIITLLFTIWTKSLWWLIALPLFFDLYITRFLPWAFWKKSKNNTFRSIMDWVDAIVFALVAVYIINIYFFQNYQIPSSSLEKSLLVGDFLFVSKISYGPRVPNTPISFPLAQHTIPILNCKSYLDKPHWDYKRVKGLSKIKRNDIVVFNFPTGDTVPVNMPNPDYYSLCNYIATSNGASVEEAAQYIKNHPEKYGKVVYRPVDRRENYVKRCVGLPGDSLQIIDNQLYIDGKPIADRPGVQYNYYVQTKGAYLSEKLFRDWGVSNEDRSMLPDGDYIAQFLPFKKDMNGKTNPIYHLPLTKKALAQVKKNPLIDTVFIESDTIGGFNIGGSTYPLNEHFTWTRDNYGPIWIPKKDATIDLNEENLILYAHVIRHYEGKELLIKNGKAFIDGKEVKQYTFKMDYYWMMGDNRHNSADSRAWGFVPEDHVVGKPILVWLSLDKDRKLFDGKIRWKRLFMKAS